MDRKTYEVVFGECAEATGLARLCRETNSEKLLEDMMFSLEDRISSSRTYAVNTIYRAFMGEVSAFGIGSPCTFLRLAGCNLRCYADKGGCDTPEALEGKCGRMMSIDAIIERLLEIGVKLICLTGGEPLMQPFIDELLHAIVNAGFMVVVETNGSIDLHPFLTLKRVSFIVDVKSPSTGMSDRMYPGNYAIMRKSDFVKFVIRDEEDLKFTSEWYEKYRNTYKGKVGVGTFWGEFSYERLSKWVQENHYPFYLNMQAHKMQRLYDCSVEMGDSARPYIKDLPIPREI